ncbi:MAG: hypothetical protein R2749_05010 [Acidimicrobiales bacterium]
MAEDAVDDGSGWASPTLGVRFRLIGVPGRCAVHVTDTAEAGYPFHDLHRQFPIGVVGVIPVVWWQGVGSMEHERHGGAFACGSTVHPPRSPSPRTRSCSPWWCKPP